MENYADIFAGPAEGTSPSMFEQHSRGQLADSVETQLGAGPAINGLRRSADERRHQDVLNNEAEDADFMEHGLDRGMAHANVEGQVGDVLSESKARRGFLPFASQAHDQAFGDAATQNDIRYGNPARIAARGHLEAAEATASGRLATEQTRQDGRAAAIPMQGLLDALNDYISKTGKMPTEAQVQQLKQAYGSATGQPQQ
jgi:hypothetical protein